MEMLILKKVDISIIIIIIKRQIVELHIHTIAILIFFLSSPRAESARAVTGT